MLLRELRKPAPTFRWGWMASCLWPIAAVFGVISYRGYISHGWASITLGCAFLSFNFAVAAIVNQLTAPYRRKIELLSELVRKQSLDGPDLPGE